MKKGRKVWYSIICQNNSNNRYEDQYVYFDGPATRSEVERLFTKAVESLNYKEFMLFKGRELGRLIKVERK